MPERFELAFPGGGRAAAVTVAEGEALDAAVRALDLEPRPVSVAVVGGAAGMSTFFLDRVAPLLAGVVAPFVEARGGVVVDGGTDTGVSRLLGRARSAGGFDFPLVGVLPAQLAAVGNHRSADDASDLEPNHTHFLLVPGSTWGDEVTWLSRAASCLATDSRAVTLLANGGDIAWDDIEASIAAGRPVVVLAGSGRTADVLAAGLLGGPSTPRTEQLLASGLVHQVEIDAAADLVALLEGLLDEALREADRPA